MEGQRAEENAKGGKQSRQINNERKRLMALNSRFLGTLQGHLWSVLTSLTVLFPSWSFLWLSAQLETTLEMFSMNSFLYRFPGYVNYSLLSDSANLHVVSSSVVLDCKPNLRERNGTFLLMKFLHQGFFPYACFCTGMMICYELWELCGWLSGADKFIKSYFYSQSVGIMICGGIRWQIIIVEIVWSNWPE